MTGGAGQVFRTGIPSSGALAFGCPGLSLSALGMRVSTELRGRATPPKGRRMIAVVCRGRPLGLRTGPVLSDAVCRRRFRET